MDAYSSNVQKKTRVVILLVFCRPGVRKMLRQSDLTRNNDINTAFLAKIPDADLMHAHMNAHGLKTWLFWV